MTSSDAPILAVTLGDPSGIGPEITAQTLAAVAGDATSGHDGTARVRGLAVGPAEALRQAIAVRGLGAEVRPVDRVADAKFEPGVLDILDVGAIAEDPAWGQVSAAAGRAALDAIEAAAGAALAGEVAGIVTAPINKEAIWAAGSAHLGHTELLAELTGAERVQTMFVVRGLKIFFTTRHMSLRQALDAVTRGTVERAIADSWTSLEVLGHDQPRLAVAALNPHGGEGGSFGTEEIDAIAPACKAQRAYGRPVVGPVPADAVFHQGLQGRYDAVLCHFHDQGHIAAKTVDFEGAVTVTMGLPILRTSVDHGTAFDIAGTGAASHHGMLAAYRTAAEYISFVDRMRATYRAGDTANSATP